MGHLLFFIFRGWTAQKMNLFQLFWTFSNFFEPFWNFLNLKKPYFLRFKKVQTFLTELFQKPVLNLLKLFELFWISVLNLCFEPFGSFEPLFLNSFEPLWIFRTWKRHILGGKVQKGSNLWSCSTHLYSHVVNQFLLFLQRKCLLV